MNSHTLAEFRTRHLEWLDAQLTDSIASLHEHELVTMSVVSQDGMRVRASDKAAGFRRRGRRTRNRSHRSQRSDSPSSRDETPPKAKAEPRMSTTGPEARVMKLADGELPPAFNAQLAVDTATSLIAGVDLENIGSDMRQMVPMHEQIEQRYGHTPGHCPADAGYSKS